MADWTGHDPVVQIVPVPGTPRITCIIECRRCRSTEENVVPGRETCLELAVVRSVLDESIDGEAAMRELDAELEKMKPQ
jgi:hypothetical protein